MVPPPAGFAPAENRPAIAMETRPRTSFVLKLKGRRCPKCGALVNNQRTRCKRCTQTLTKPAKRQRKKSKFRTRKAKRRAKAAS